MIVPTELGWMVDLPCGKCNRENCSGRVSMWIPNLIGNVEEGVDEEGALQDALKTQQAHKIFCEQV